MSESTGDQGSTGASIGLVPEGVTPGTRDDWVSAAAAVLRRGGRLPADDRTAAPIDADAVLAALARSTVEGLTVPPLGTGRARVPAARRAAETTDGWDIRVLVNNPNGAVAAAETLADLEGGATSIWLRVGDAGVPITAMTSVLQPVLLDVAPVVLDISAGTAGAAYRTFADLLTGRGVTPAAGTSFGADPLGGALRTGTEADLGAAPELAELAELAIDVGIGALVVDGTAAHHAGAGDAQEIGWSLAAGVAYLRALEAAGIPPSPAAGLIGFRYAVTADQFAGIAKLRAARQLWSRVLQISGVTDAAVQHQHAVTSRQMFSRYDPWVNMLRGTIAAFAAGAGGAQAVTVLPFDSALGLPDGFGRRIARNVSHLLIGESHVAVVADPAGGAPAVEQLTDEIAAAGWAEFGRIEQAGGAAAALADGSFAGRIADLRERRARDIATRRQPIIGVSEFPSLDEHLPQRPAGAGEPSGSWSAPYEHLRDTPASHPVFLATLGPVAAHSTRAGFAANALAAGGISTIRAGATSTTEEVLAGYHPSATPVACLAGTDAAYADVGAWAIAALREAGATTILLAGRPPPELAGLIDDHLAAGTDIPALCTRVRGYLGEQTS